MKEGNVTFMEQASQFGMQTPGNSMGVIIFHYDLDGDLIYNVLNTMNKSKNPRPS